jgi:hypothetical protein
MNRKGAFMHVIKGLFAGLAGVSLCMVPDPAQNDRQIRRNLTDQSGSI